MERYRERIRFIRLGKVNKGTLYYPVNNLVPQQWQYTYIHLSTQQTRWSVYERLYQRTFTINLMLLRLNEIHKCKMLTNTQIFIFKYLFTDSFNTTIQLWSISVYFNGLIQENAQALVNQIMSNLYITATCIQRQF